MLAPARAQPVLTLDPARAVSVGGHLAMLRDHEGLRSPAQAAAAADWQLLPGPLSAGYTDDVIWLRLRLQNPENGPTRWLMQFSHALLDDVRIYQLDEHKGWQQVGRSGEDLGRSNWLIDARKPVLPLLLSPGRSSELLLRLRSKNAMSVYVTVSTPEAYGAAALREYLAYGAGFGFGLLLLLFHSLFWQMSRERLSAWYLLYVATALGVEMLTSGLPQQLLDMPVGLSDPLLGTVMCLSLAVGTRFAVLLLDVEAHWRGVAQGLCWLMLLISLAAAALVLGGSFGAGLQLMQQSAMLNILILMGLALALLGRDQGQARAFLLIFGVYYAGVVISFLRNMGLIHSSVWTNNAAVIGTSLHMLLMSLRLNRRYGLMRREKEQAQRRLVEMVARQNERLDQAVRSRTAELQQEISQRERLEQELRAALETERQAKQSQLDFVAMVSHEFRTPLAIINTTAQQIARNLDAAREKTLARCANLRSAAQRMAALVDEYLSADRMDTGNAPFQPHDCTQEELRRLLEGLVADWPEGRVRLQLGELPLRLCCDLGLLRVALRNLLANADRHTPAGLAIELSAQPRTTGEQGLSFRISNPGPEIPADEVPRLFEKYFRGRAAQQQPGAGLGLYLVRQIAELHGGRARLTSAGQEGPIVFALDIAVASPCPGALPSPA
ncbi:MAG: 7TM diverse intracellular signaling domain-containing protein [Roseateles sp.]